MTAVATVAVGNVSSSSPAESPGRSDLVWWVIGWAISTAVAFSLFLHGLQRWGMTAARDNGDRFSWRFSPRCSISRSGAD